MCMSSQRRTKSRTLGDLFRLDTILNALREFFGNRLSFKFAPLEETQPRKILELGSIFFLRSHDV